MFAPLASLVIPACAVGPVHGKTGGSAAGSRFGTYLSEQASLLESYASKLPAQVAEPLEHKPDVDAPNGNAGKGNSVYGNTPNHLAADNASNGTATPAPATSEDPETPPVIATKTNALTKPSVGKDKRPASARQPDATTSCQSITVANPPLNVPMPKTFVEFGFSTHNQSGALTPEEREKSQAAAHATKPEPLGSAPIENSGHQHNEIGPAVVTRLQTVQEPPVSSELEVKSDSGQKVGTGIQLPQNDQPATPDPAKPQISRMDPVTHPGN